HPLGALVRREWLRAGRGPSPRAVGSARRGGLNESSPAARPFLPQWEEGAFVYGGWPSQAALLALRRRHPAKARAAVSAIRAIFLATDRSAVIKTGRWPTRYP